MGSSTLVVFYGMTFKKNNNKYYCNGAFGRYIDTLSQNYESLILAVPVKYTDDDHVINDYQLQSKNIIIQEVPHYSSYLSAMKKSRIIKKAIKKYSEEWDTTIYIRHPNPFTKFVYKLAKRNNLEVVLHLVGDTKGVISQGSKYSGIIKRIALKYVDVQDKFISEIIKVTPTLANGSGLRRLYSSDSGNVKEIRTSSFYEKEIEKSPKKLNKNNINLLYVGYLRHEKGLIYLLDAIDMMSYKQNIKLTIVGDGELKQELINIVEEKKLEEQVEFKGHMALGEELFSIYKENDIFILPSISEGTPRVLIEAMCNALPIIATNTGGIPYTIEDGINGLLVPIKSPHEIAEAIDRIIFDNDLREQIIMNGINFAKENTLEKHVQEVYQFIQHKSNDIDKKKTYKSNSKRKVINFIFISIPVHMIMLMTALIPNSTIGNKIRGFMLKPFFKSSGKNIQIASGVIINHINNIKLGNNVYLAHNSWFNGVGNIDIEDNVIIGPFSVLATSEHKFINGIVSNSESLIAPIKIGKGTWIASQVVITGGVTISTGCTVAAGAVVTKDVHKDSIVGGVPAQLIKIR